jgi:2-hydroxychromene-2-carboxylate isomerase
MQHVWIGGGDAADPGRIAALTQALAPKRDPASDAVKGALRSATQEAIALGLFGVPTFELDGRLFWGLDALPMLRASVRGDAWFDGPAWDAAALPRPGVKRSQP